MFRNMSFILLFVILAIIFLDSAIPLLLKQILYSISLTIKSLIIALLPFIIFGLLFKSMVTLSNNASKIIGIILLLVCCSNFISTFLSHYVGEWVYDFDLSMIVPNGKLELSPLWSWNFPKIIANDKAMFAGIIFGIIASKFYQEKAINISRKLEVIIGIILKVIVYIIPLFVSGFVVKLQYDSVMMVIIKDYAMIFGIIALVQYSYIFLAYFFLSNMKLSSWVSNVRNILPAAITGFTTMSSAASMPIMIVGVEKNAENKDLAKSVVPATVNIHLIGDCFAIPILAYAILKSFGVSEPDLFNYIIFTFYFVLAKFSVAAIPGGGILVMLPVLERYLGFNAEMLSLITALYILFDPVITCANIFGNGAFAKMIDKCMQKLGH